MNPIIISTMIGVVTFILTIVVASYLNQRRVDQLIEHLENRSNEKLDGTEKQLGPMFEGIDTNFDSVNGRLDSLRAELRAEFAAVRVELTNLNQRLERVERQINAFTKPSLPK